MATIFASSNTQAQAPDEPSDVRILKDQYALHSRLFNNVLQDISEAEAKNQMEAGVNSLQWIAGHTLDIQYNLAMLLGVATENPYAEQFAYGKPFSSKATYPALANMKADWNALAPKVSAAITAISQEQLNSKSPFPIPYNEQTIRGVLAFQMHHLAYEIGQMGIYRRFLGKEAMSYQ